MKLFAIPFFAKVSLFVVGILGAKYKIEVKVEGGLEGLSSSDQAFKCKCNQIIYFSIELLIGLLIF